MFTGGFLGVEEGQSGFWLGSGIPNRILIGRFKAANAAVMPHLSFRQLVLSDSFGMMLLDQVTAIKVLIHLVAGKLVLLLYMQHSAVS